MTEEELLDFEKTILIVDDESVILSSLSAMLMDLGYKVLLAEDGEQGVQLFSKRKDEIDLVILDIIMPRMGGFEAFERIKEIDPEAKVIVTSGFPRDDRFDAFLAAGAVAIIKKPYRRQAMAELLKKYI